MRGMLLLGVFAALIYAMTLSPFSGLLAWAWFSFMHPQRETFGFAEYFSFDWYLAVLTMIAWLFSREHKFFPTGTTPILLYLFALWICVTTYFAIDSAQSYAGWEQTEKTLILVLFVMLMTTNMVRMQALLWVIVIALGYFAVKGAGFVLLGSGGSVYGPEASMIGDNNHLSVALASLLPLLVYLYRSSTQVWIKRGCFVVAAAIVVTIVGTYSRGGFLALLAIGGLMALRSRAKVSIALVGLVAILIIVQVAPQKWRDRMATIGATEVDGSVQGRYDAWGTAWNVAMQRPTGGGFNFGERQAVWDRYSGLPERVPFRAAHSIYYQVLGEHGFVGLTLFLLIMLSAVRNTQVSTRLARNRGHDFNGLELANALQLSILGIAIGGISLSLAYYDMFLTLYGMTFALRRILEGNPASEQAIPESSPFGATGKTTRISLENNDGASGPPS